MYIFVPHIDTFTVTYLLTLRVVGARQMTPQPGSRFLDSAPVAYLTPKSWCTAEGAILVDPGGDRSGMIVASIMDADLITSHCIRLTNSPPTQQVTHFQTLEHLQILYTLLTIHTQS